MGWSPAANGQNLTSQQSTPTERRQSNETEFLEQARLTTRRRNALVNFNLDPRTKAALEIAHLLQRIGDILHRRASTQSTEN